jgi:uncharacterized protein (TIGR03435 family)
MRFRLVRTSACFAIAAGLTLYAQQEQPKPMDAQGHPKFEVATIKRADPDDKSDGFHTEGVRLFYENQTVNKMLLFAYSVNGKQIINAPDWFDTRRFDIHGVADLPGVPSVPQQAEMLRALLEERMGLKLHHDSRDMTRVVISVAHGGPKMEATKSTNFLPDETCNGSNGVLDCRFTGVSMELFAEIMRFFLDRPVIDGTGLDGRYDFRLKWTRDDAPPSVDGNSAPGLYTAMPEQIGLKAESSKGPTDVIVIDHAEPPSAD